MADQQGRAIDDKPPADQDKGPTLKVQPCLGCNGLPHGSVGAKINCYEQELLRLRALVARFGPEGSR